MAKIAWPARRRPEFPPWLPSFSCNGRRNSCHRGALGKQQTAVPVVFNGMSKMSSTMTEARPSRGYVVDRPRPTDALGDSLRNVFGGGDGLPRDMARLLAKLDRGSRGRA